jgi:hypothetical protein
MLAAAMKQQQLASTTRRPMIRGGRGEPTVSTSLPALPSAQRRTHSTSPTRPSRFYRRDEHARLHHSVNLPVLGCDACPPVQPRGAGCVPPLGCVESVVPDSARHARRAVVYVEVLVIERRGCIMAASRVGRLSRGIFINFTASSSANFFTSFSFLFLKRQNNVHRVSGG